MLFRIFLIALLVLLSGCGSRPPQENFFLVKPNGSGEDLDKLARLMAEEGQMSFSYERLQWTESEATDSYYLGKWGVTVHLRNAPGACPLSSIDDENRRTFTAWAGLYNPTFLGRTQVDQSSRLLQRLAAAEGWMVLDGRQCEAASA